MSSVTFPVSLGGDGSTVTDDGNASTGLANDGHRTRFVPALAQVVAIADGVLTNATAAASSASTASDHAATAANYANSAASSYDSFDDRYLGAKAADPTLDNDGNALLTGALYFNTVANAMKVYTGSAWDAAYVPGGSYLSTADIGVTVQGYDATTLKSTTIGVTVQGYDADTAKLDVAQSWTAQQTFKEVKDTVYTITDGAGFEIDPANGSIQVVTLGASRTPAATNFEAGQTVLLGIDDGSAYSITWTTVNPTWVKAGGTASAPTLASSGYTWVILWKVGSTMYGCEVGKP